ncbi:MAG: ABC transporter ATP-binding protein [Gemmatimonadaceae bacterium]
MSTSSASGHPEPGAMERLARLLHGERRDIVVVLFYAALAGLFALTLPVSVGAIVGLVQGGLRLQPVLLLIAYVVVGTLVSGGLQVLQLGVVERIQERVFTRMALEFSYRLPRIKYRVAMNTDLPEAMNRLFEAVTIQKSLSKVLLDSSQAALTVLAGLLVLTLYHPYFALFGILLLGILGIILRVSGRAGLATSLDESRFKYRAVHWLEEQARAYHAFKFSAQSGLGMRRMDDILVKYLASRRAHFRILARQSASVVVLRALTVGSFLVLGTQLVVSRQISLGQFVAAELVIVTVLLAVEKLMFAMSSVYDLLTSAEKAGHIADLTTDESGVQRLPELDRGISVELRDVTYRYLNSHANALSGMTLSIASGERLGINGVEGSGSTTLLRLFGGLLDDAEGVVLMDAVPLGALDTLALREQTGQFLATSELFDGTVEENITMGRPSINSAMVRQAIADAGLTRDIESLPQGILTPLGADAQRLPNRVALKLLFARAIASNPRLLLIDDLFQNLSAEDRTQLTTVLVDSARRWTLAVVSRDPAMLDAMDRVVTLKHGQIAHDQRVVRTASATESEPIHETVAGGPALLIEAE